MPEKKLDLIEFATGKMAEPGTSATQVVRASFLKLAVLAARFTIPQMTLGVIPSPQIFPALLIDRKILPSVIPLVEVQPSIASPCRSATTQWSSRS